MKTESFTVTDSNTVSASGSATVNVQGTPLVASATCPTSGVTVGKPFNCTVTASGDTGPYTGTGTISRTENSKGTKTESFTVSDANGVTATATAGVTVGGQPLVVTATCPTSGVTAGKPFNCTVSATGGTGPYTGVGSISRTEPTKGSKTESFTITDANSVSATATASVSVGAQPLVVTVSCPANASVGVPFNCTVTATGGTTPYTGTGTFSRTENSKGLKTESFTVTDSNTIGASGSANVAVSGSPLVVTVTCPTSGLTVGKPFNCTVTASGGTAPYTGTGTFSRTESIKGSRSELFSVSDANSATASGTAMVSVFGQPLVPSVVCPSSGVTAGKPFNCTVTATGGTGPYTGVGTFSRTVSAKGSSVQTFTVSDTNGVAATASATVSVGPQPLVATFNVGGSGVVGSPETFTASASGGTTPYTFGWAFGDSSTGTGNPVTHTYGAAGNYTVTLTVVDANNASATSSRTVSIVGATLTACFTESLTTALTSTPISFDASCSSSSGTITSYAWNFGDSNTGTGKTVTHAYSSAGNFTVTLTVMDSNSLTATATSTKVITAVSGKNVLTDGSFCALPNNQFSLQFVSDKTGTYTLVSSKPGLFNDNAFDNGTAGTPVTLHISVPYPFITQGGNPIQVSSSFTLTNQGCFVPAFDQTKNFSISTAGGHLSNSGKPAIVLSDYGMTPTIGTTTTQVTVSGMIPSTGLVYVTIHLDYGLKGTTQWVKDIATFPATNSALPGTSSGWTVTINNPQSYAFSFVDGTPGSTTPTSVNVWKLNSGFAGAITNGFTEQPMSGVTAKIYDSNGNLLGITTTDLNGIYNLAYKNSGNHAYTVKAVMSATLQQSATVSINGNHVAQTNFALSLSGDVNGDCKVTVSDLAIVGSAAGAQPGQGRYNQYADINGDGSIDVADLAMVARNFNLNC